ncbi:DUF4870 family protein [Candidatus Symbiobacter mobilis]|uniref:Transmembrane protein n=1 Tax=Candidatus Symbiobacter mobilis CR TaxID=946483 RepID=U5N9E8_9BURK|nr:hypothetical protein [Candidatus Symbiobacter mobilis]AGX86848.1 hypothetical protein Cenrod_0741 [Candidatus Symbiobacter mobilis CR]
MNEDFQQPSAAAIAAELRRLDALNTIGTISYVLHLIVAVGAVIPGGQWGPVLLIVALVLDLAKRDDAEGTWHASHFRWRLRTVLFAGLWYMLTAPLWLLFLAPGWIAWVMVSLWFLYRIVYGFVWMNRGQAMPMP